MDRLPSSKLSRRDLLKVGVGLVALTGCSSASVSPTPTETPVPTPTEIPALTIPRFNQPSREGVVFLTPAPTATQNPDMTGPNCYIPKSYQDAIDHLTSQAVVDLKVNLIANISDSPTAQARAWANSKNEPVITAAYIKEAMRTEGLDFLTGLDLLLISYRRYESYQRRLGEYYRTKTGSTNVDPNSNLEQANCTLKVIEALEQS